LLVLAPASATWPSRVLSILSSCGTISSASLSPNLNERCPSSSAPPGVVAPTSRTPGAAASVPSSSSATTACCGRGAALYRSSRNAGPLRNLGPSRKPGPLGKNRHPASAVRLCPGARRPWAGTRGSTRMRARRGRLWTTVGGTAPSSTTGVAAVAAAPQAENCYIPLSSPLTLYGSCYSCRLFACLPTCACGAMSWVKSQRDR
ncbi:unnamed protein product, partial [Ectocarpus fasciculatus]